MNQSESLKAIASATGMHPKVVKEFFVIVGKVAERNARKLETLVLPGIGRLTAKYRKAYMGRNPATGKAVKVAAKNVVKFSIAKPIKVAAKSAKVKGVKTKGARK